MNETQIGKLVIDLQIKTQALEKGLETAKKKLKEIESQNKELENSNKGLENSWIAVAATATIALNGIINSIKSATEEYKAHEQAMSSLQNVADYTGQSMDDLSGIMEKYEGIMTKSDLATTIKNFTLMGMKAEETEKMIEALTNSAIRNRNANYTVSEAVRVASEGYRQGLSTLSDSAGVTENLSVMLDNYAQSIGKTASQLTETEKNQAYLNRTMYAAQPFAGAMEDYLDSLAGKQGEYSQSMRETQVAFAEAMEPTLTTLLELGTGILNILNNLIGSNKSMTAGTTAFTVTLLAAIVVVKAYTAAKKAYTKSAFAATAATKGFTAALASNPLGLAVLAISSLVGITTAATTAINEKAEAQAKLNEITERYNQIQEGTYAYTDENIAQAQADKEAIEEQIDLMQKKLDLQQKIQEENGNSTDLYGTTSTSAQNAAMSRVTQGNPEQINEMKESLESATSAVNDYSAELKQVEKDLKNAQDANGNYGNSIEELNSRLEESTDYLDEANVVKNISKALDIENTKTMQKEAAQLRVNANQMQNYLNIVKKGDKSTTEYQNAVTALAKAYPEAATAEGILIDQAQGFIDAEQLKADEAWKGSQNTINGYIEMLNVALQSESVQRQVAENIGISYEQLAPKLQSVLGLLQAMAGYTPETTPNITPTVSTARSSGGSSYSNKRLDNYKKEIEHKKAMDQISLQQEILMYEKALRNYARTTDEKRELREKIYELNKELAQKEKEVLDQQTEDYEAYIQKQKNIKGAAYDVNEQTKDYNKIIQMHKNYLNQIMKDERLSLEERKEMYREELQIIRDYEQQKRDLRVEQIDNTVSQLTSAITKQLEEMQEKEKNIIDENLKVIEEWKDARINAINEEYDARIEAINKELEALNKAEEEKSRAEEDAEYEKKRKRLEELVAFEHDATTKANYQKELDKLIAEYQKTLDNRTLADKKEALNNEKELLQEEQDSKIEAIEQEAERQSEVYNKQLEELEKYYEEQIGMAQDTAEKMLLNTSKNQDKILELLKNYGNKYEITGQTLGEKLAQGINDGLASKIENIIANIQDKIDAGIEAQIAKMASSAYKYDTESGKSSVKSITNNVVQNNYIEQNPETPSETYRKLNNISENLASQLAGG